MTHQGTQHAATWNIQEGEEVDRRVLALQQAYADSKDASDMQAKVALLEQEPGPGFEQQVRDLYYSAWLFLMRTAVRHLCHKRYVVVIHRTDAPPPRMAASVDADRAHAARLYAQHQRVLDAPGHVHHALPGSVRGCLWYCCVFDASTSHMLTNCILATTEACCAFSTQCMPRGLIFLNLNMGWQDVYSRASLLFFVVAFLTFMSIAGYVSFTERVKVRNCWDRQPLYTILQPWDSCKPSLYRPPKVFVRERLNGYYGVAVFVLSDTLATAPFIFLIALVSTIVMYFWTNLNTEFVRIVYFVLNLFLSLMVVESIMMAIGAHDLVLPVAPRVDVVHLAHATCCYLASTAPIVPHYLVGIAAGAGLMGLYMLCCGFFIPKNSMTQPVFVYPIYYMAYHTYSFHGTLITALLNLLELRMHAMVLDSS